jgi:hypothetical protein
MALPIDNKDDAASLAAARHIRGNLPAQVKHTLETVLHKVMSRSPVFGSSIGERIVITEASIVPKAEEPSRTEARVVCEVTVGEGGCPESESRVRVPSPRPVHRRKPVKKHPHPHPHPPLSSLPRAPENQYLT